MPQDRPRSSVQCAVCSAVHSSIRVGDGDMGGGRAGNHTRRWMGHRMTDHCVGDLTWVGLVAGGVGGGPQGQAPAPGLGLTWARAQAQRSTLRCQLPGARCRIKVRAIPPCRTASCEPKAPDQPRPDQPRPKPQAWPALFQSQSAREVPGTRIAEQAGPENRQAGAAADAGAGRRRAGG